jgi:hypothetical protein
VARIGRGEMRTESLFRNPRDRLLERIRYGLEDNIKIRLPKIGWGA